HPECNAPRQGPIRATAAVRLYRQSRKGRMKFIYADSLDFVDPGYDFERDQFARGRKPYWDDVFAHELLKTPPYDGLLVSRALLGGPGVAGKYSESQAMRFLREGARRFLRLDRKDCERLLLFGDCGAFSYHQAH